MKYHAKWKQSSFWTTGIWPTNRMNVDHNLFNPSKAYQSLEVTDNSENDILNFNVESENDVNNQLLQSTNLTAMDCPSISTDNQVKNEKNSQISCTKFISTRSIVNYLQSSRKCK